MLKKDDTLLYPGQPADFAYLEEAKTYIEVYTLCTQFSEDEIIEAFNKSAYLGLSDIYDVFLNKQLNEGLKIFFFKLEKNDVPFNEPFWDLNLDEKLKQSSKDNFYVKDCEEMEKVAKELKFFGNK
jgi:hypothetical protein